MCRFLVSRGILKDAQDKDGLTALHLAARHPSADTAQALIECGVDTEIRTKASGALSCPSRARGRAQHRPERRSLTAHP